MHVPTTFNWSRCQQWAPDGTLTCHAADADGRQGLFKVDVNTGAVTPIVTTRDGYLIIPTWSADGRVLVYVRNADATTIVVRDVSTGRETELLRVDGFKGLGGVSPDGRLVAYATNDQTSGRHVIHLVPTAGGPSRELHSIARPMDLSGWLRNLEWTPDSKNLVFAATDGGWILPVSGGAPIRIDPSLPVGSADGIRIHPDGRHVAYRVDGARTEIWALENLLTAAGPAR